MNATVHNSGSDQPIKRTAHRRTGTHIPLSSDTNVTNVLDECSNLRSRYGFAEGVYLVGYNVSPSESPLWTNMPTPYAESRTKSNQKPAWDTYLTELPAAADVSPILSCDYTALCPVPQTELLLLHERPRSLAYFPYFINMTVGLCCHLTLCFCLCLSVMCVSPIHFWITETSFTENCWFIK
jgi:hypothetical protein